MQGYHFFDPSRGDVPLSQGLLQSILGPAMQDVPGVSYYVDVNYGNDANDGLSWQTAFRTIAHAMAVSHANIATAPNWANRNRIFASGDTFVENLVAFAQKTDVIGVGSCDGIPTACLEGSHAPVNTAYGARFINMDFRVDAGVGLTLIAGVGGCQVLDCLLSANGAPTTAILATGGTDWKFKRNRIRDWSGAGGFTTAGISLGTGGSPRTIITDNDIGGCAVGVLVNAGRTGVDSCIDYNRFHTTGKFINDASSTFLVSRNRAVTGTAKAAGTSCTVATALSVDNIVTGTDGTISVPTCNFGAQS